MKEGFKSDIMCGPWYFGPGSRHNPNHAGSVAVTKDGKWQTLQPCFEVEDPDLADVHETEKELALVQYVAVTNACPGRRRRPGLG